MRIRTGAALAVVLAACLAPTASAATPKTACKLLVDAAGDATPAAGVPSRPSLDILSADVATGTRNLVGVLRLGSVAAEPTATTGVTYRLGWRAGGTQQELTLTVFSDGSSVAEFHPSVVFGGGAPPVAVKALVDPASASVVWTVPRKANPVLRKAGTKLSGLTAAVETPMNLKTPSGSPVSFTFQGSFLPGGDDASSGATYTDLAPSCVKGV